MECGVFSYGEAKGRQAKNTQTLQLLPRHAKKYFSVFVFRPAKTWLYDMAQISHHNSVTA
jgi:hypothetical protein